LWYWLVPKRNGKHAGKEGHAMTTLETLAAFFDVAGRTGAQRIVVVGAVLFGLWLGLARTGFAQSERNRTWLLVAVPLLAWLALTWTIAPTGVFQVFPVLPLAIVLPVAVGLVLLMRSRRIATLLDAMPLSWLVGLQVYRVFGGAFLVQLALGNLSAAFALPAGTGDVLVGVLALPVAFYLARYQGSGRAIAVGWNVLGILDLAVAITLGFLASTGRLGGVPRPLVYPLVMVPAFGVPLSLILHGLSLWQLRGRAGRSSIARDIGLPAAASRPA
jgi:hypothetical protein